ncbi:hypothetical protein CO134_02530 [Candidatus Kuenenbacteria bacterium CG_4_9_14_3_um_filter_39_14]|uniref:Uncharacterized protein n=7 Tax=Candidatus Kueneniibacteriota TaxID=1752740 RepID=A0A2M7MGU0_9BACT|nr:MAG: hypothetical protein AUK13_02475 [Candidatus Kuenenbacteria bacterium CG2_30_39_24]PIP29225.1 MAG: hypothetical protein COX28_00230 [Candidatus Kuenenbacteria bacterium CG23_combo_of_CG06-09_8_20_14_all_39_39]PIP75685.1 MAG: hypothetical protein COW86_02340 [Candidatus Kuenenbacteria bacterium CG22_combo_CG10-13_8_21_14_all_39_9]PIR80596.1 MAG: hypothetical protein COU24_03155 [Candidatus Kuenenbacteria bacterium CG10_big_fil_rev_8_21_14_0_10_39_14]PIX92217.1 MAG: hypothetical protein C
MHPKQIGIGPPPFTMRSWGKILTFFKMQKQPVKVIFHLKSHTCDYQTIKGVEYFNNGTVTFRTDYGMLVIKKNEITKVEVVRYVN